MRRSRSGVIVGVTAVVLGGMTGGALALRGEPAAALPSRSADPAASPQLIAPATAARSSAGGAPAPSAAPAPAAAARSAAALSEPASPDLHDAAVAQIKASVMRFIIWSHDHPGARCPDAVALGGSAVDPWGRSLRIVCADQPGDQVAGVVSFGPDGLPGTSDDVASWSLGPDVTDLLRGAPWGSVRSAPASAGSKRTASRGAVTRGTVAAVPLAPPSLAAAPPAAPTPAAPPAAPGTRPPASAGAGSSDTDGEGIPNRR